MGRRTEKIAALDMANSLNEDDDYCSLKSIL